MVKGTCKNHHRGQSCRVSHASEAFPSRLPNSPHTESSQGSSASFPHHHHLAQVVAVCRQGVPLCILPKEAKQVWEPALNRQLRHRLSSGELEPYGQFQTFCINPSTRALLKSSFRSALSPSPGCQRGQSHLTPNEQRHLINHKLRVSTWTTTFGKWERGSLNWGCHKYALLVGSGQITLTHLEAGCIMVNLMDSGIILPGVNPGSSTY